MKKVRIGIVGCGGIANGKHLPSIKANADLAEVVGFCDIYGIVLKKQQKNMAVMMLKFTLITMRC